MDLINFEYNDRRVRVAQDPDGTVWWVAKDVCEILEIGNHKDAIGRLDGDEVGKTDLIDSLGRHQNNLTINESGLYTLIIRSNKPEAKKFRRWVTHEVLPSIRRYGFYMAPGASDDEEGQVPVTSGTVPVTVGRLMEAAQGIVLKRRRMRFLRSVDFETSCSLAVRMGIDSHGVTRWIEKGLLRAKRRGTDRTETQGGDQWMIKPKDVRDFIIENVSIVDIRKVDKFWLVDLLTGNGYNFKKERHAN